MNIWQEFNGSPLEWDEYIIEMKVTIDSSMSGEGCKKIKAGKFIDFLKKTMIPFIPQFRSSAKSLFSFGFFICRVV